MGTGSYPKPGRVHKLLNCLLSNSSACQSSTTHTFFSPSLHACFTRGGEGWREMEGVPAQGLRTSLLLRAWWSFLTLKLLVFVLCLWLHLPIPLAVTEELALTPIFLPVALWSGGGVLSSLTLKPGEKLPGWGSLWLAERDWDALGGRL